MFVEMTKYEYSQLPKIMRREENGVYYVKSAACASGWATVRWVKPTKPTK